MTAKTKNKKPAPMYPPFLNAIQFNQLFSVLNMRPDEIIKELDRYLMKQEQAKFVELFMDGNYQIQFRYIDKKGVTRSAYIEQHDFSVRVSTLLKRLVDALFKQTINK